MNSSDASLNSGWQEGPEEEILGNFPAASYNATLTFNKTNASGSSIFNLRDLDKADFVGDGLIGNILVLHLMKSKQVWKKSHINLFVTSLAVTDFQFVLTLPFWAVENALDFTWLFGKAMSMSVARYLSVASALKSKRRRQCFSALWMSLLIWVAAIIAALPHAIFSTTATVSNEELCLVKFPDKSADGVGDSN
ncbi:hypothetical protein JZ751_015976 [Albula glossodonta]|uniref:G-protein coupled receptors family 1 profile domain-containing protein n=1 Tax=Albula glossodonta TaxID=121402 RepID=A0A8T2NTX6_9TELE|nr:hypothetical protein JZ751_015976 [Albula glossodonta]